MRKSGIAVLNPPDDRIKEDIREAVLTWSIDNLRTFPWRKKNISAYEVFVAEMLLKRTTAKAAAHVFTDVIRTYPSLEELSDASEERLSKIIESIGYKKRAYEMITAARHIKRNFRGKFPSDKKKLMEVPFIGEYISNAILSISFDKSFPMVDSNIVRILKRVFYGNDSPLSVTKEIIFLASNILPYDKQRQFNFSMLDIGGTICLPRRPKCDRCPIKGTCKYYLKERY